MTGQRLVLCVVLLTGLWASAGFADPVRDRVLVVVDRSARMAPEAARAWGDTVLATRPEALDLVVTSFHQGLRSISEPLNDRAVWAAALGAKSPTAQPFDPESVLRELAVAPDQSRWAMVLLVVGQEPTPIDIPKNRAWLADPRYADLSGEYLGWEQAQATPKELRDYFVPFYAERQTKLMADDARDLARALSSRMVIWDVAEQPGRMRAWAAGAKVRYVGKAVKDSAQLAGAVDAMRWETQRILNSRGGATESGAGAWGAQIVMAAASLAAFGALWWHRRGGRKPGVISVTSPEIRFEPDSPVPQVQTDVVPPAEELPPQPRHAEELPPRPIEFKADLPAGALEVYWYDATGHHQKAVGTSLTPMAVEFWVGEAVPVGVDRLVCPSQNVVLYLDGCDLEPQADGVFMGIFREFRNGVDDRMALIDLVTGIGET